MQAVLLDFVFNKESVIINPLFMEKLFKMDIWESGGFLLNSTANSRGGQQEESRMGSKLTEPLRRTPIRTPFPAEEKMLLQAEMLQKLSRLTQTQNPNRNLTLQ